MKLLFVVVLALCSATGLRIQDPQGMPEPGPHHELLLDHVGSWDAVVITEGPDGEQRGKARMTTKALGKFHTVDDFEGEFMGMPFTGHGTNSYCPVRKQFVTTWADSMVPSPIVMTGDFDEATRRLTLRGEAVGMSGKLEPARIVIQYQDADHYAFEMFGPGPDGEEMRQLRIEYTRRK